MQETYERLLERYEAAQLRRFFSTCNGQGWYQSENFFNDKYVPPISKDDLGGDGGNNKEEDYEGLTKGEEGEKARSYDGPSPSTVQEDNNGDGGDNISSSNNDDSSDGENKIAMHPSISTLGDPSMLMSPSVDEQVSVVLPHEEGLLSSPKTNTGPASALAVRLNANSLPPMRGPESSKHGPSLAKEDCPPCERWFWGGGASEGGWRGCKTIKRRVAKIDLHENNLEGLLPGAPSTGNFPICAHLPPDGNEELLLGKLKVLVLFKNSLRGMIPSSYSKFVSLQHIDISHNQLSGVLPHELFEVRTLRRVHLEHNQLIEGTLPESICDLENLESLTMHWNKIAGELPSNIGRCSKLKELSIHHNCMVGVLPDSMKQLSLLERCHLNNNHFDVPTSEWVEDLYAAGNFAADPGIRPVYAKVLTILPQPDESETFTDSEDETTEEGMTIDGSRTATITMAQAEA